MKLSFSRKNRPPAPPKLPIGYCWLIPCVLKDRKPVFIAARQRVNLCLTDEGILEFVGSPFWIVDRAAQGDLYFEVRWASGKLFKLSRSSGGSWDKLGYAEVGDYIVLSKLQFILEPALIINVDPQTHKISDGM